MADIVLSTLNVRYQHSAFGLRYLLANLHELQGRTQIREFAVSKNPRDIVEALLSLQPKIVGFGVYIWNTSQTVEVISILKKVAPHVVVVVGGPEVSHETEGQEIHQLADFTIHGEADFLFYEFCRDYFATGILPSAKIISGPLPDIKKIASPYAFYSDEDIRNRVIYVEASRGCPYKCEYCLSSLDVSVRNFELETFLSEMDRLIQRGARQLKFVDRTFNLSPSISTRILEFFLQRIHLGLFLHFEMVPDRLPEDLKVLIEKFPQGALQFEIGVQTWSPEVAKNVSRRQDYQKIQDNLCFLREKTGVHTHADLIVGLPGETLQSFAHGFDQLVQCEPDEIQVGILKRLKGAPISRHDQAFEMVYQDQPPFQILKNKTMDYVTLQKFNRFAQFWDHYGNSGNFLRFVKFLREKSVETHRGSLFYMFWGFTDFLYQRHQNTHSLALLSLVESAFLFLTQELAVPAHEAAHLLASDYQSSGRELPGFLKAHAGLQHSSADKKHPSEARLPRRQRRHLTAPH